MNVMYFDLETTAPPGGDARDAEQAIPVQAALGYYNMDEDKGEPLTGFPLLINPGCPISEESTHIHGITDAMVTHATDADIAINAIAGHLTDAVNNGVPIVGMNLAYDFTVLDRRLRTHGLTTLGDRASDARIGDPAPGRTHSPLMLVLDALVIDRGVDRYRKGPRKLTDLCQRYGIELTNAHDADADALASARVLGVLRDIARATQQMQNTMAAFDRKIFLRVPAHPAGHRPELALTLTTPAEFANLATMSADDMQTAQARWYTDFADFITSGNRPHTDVWPVRQLADAPSS